MRIVILAAIVVAYAGAAFVLLGGADARDVCEQTHSRDVCVETLR